MRSSKANMLGILFTFFFAITIRFYMLASSNVIHEIGIDSFFYHNEAAVLLKYHSYTWWLHPLSLFGLYPYSDSPGVPTLIAQYSSISGLPIEFSILVFNIIIVFFAVFSMWILSLKIKNNFYFTFFTTTIFIFAPILIIRTQWSIGEREFLVFLLPFISILIFYILQGHHTHMMVVLTAFTYFTFLTIHLISLFVYGLFLPIFISRGSISSICRNFCLKIHLNKIFDFGVSILLITFSFYSLFILNVIFDMPYSFSIINYTQTSLFSGTDPFTILLNIAVSLSGAVGILLPIFLPLGLLAIILHKNYNLQYKYLYWAFVFSLPILINRMYSRPIIVFLSSMFIGYGAYILVRRIRRINKKGITIKKGNLYINNNKAVLISIILIVLVVNTAFTMWYEEYRSVEEYGKSYVIPYSKDALPQTYEIGIYQKQKIPKTWITNDWFTGQRIQAYSSIPETPGISGCPTFLYNPVYFKMIDHNKLGIRKSTEMEFKYTHQLFVSTYMYNESRAFITIMQHPVYAQESKHMIYKYNIIYAVEYKPLSGRYTGYHSHSIKRSDFYLSLHKNTYIIFSNSNYIIYYLNTNT